jgi:chorismate dehydratase
MNRPLSQSLALAFRSAAGRGSQQVHAFSIMMKPTEACESCFRRRAGRPYNRAKLGYQWISSDCGGPHMPSDDEKANRTYRLGVVSYLNAKPLIAGLEQQRDLKLVFEVPSLLPRMLADGRVDVALIPVIDLIHFGRKWRIVSDACIGCDGETLTVRVFSRVPPEQITRLYVDGDSHTSVILATVIWKELYGQSLDLLPFTGRETIAQCEAVLLIGDKVVNNSLIDYEIQTDLGLAWKSLTSLPFVFAVWAGPRDHDFADLARRLEAARDLGVASAPMIAADLGPGMGWPVALAERYLTARLAFHLGPRQRSGIKKFFELAGRYDLVSPVEELALP